MNESFQFENYTVEIDRRAFFKGLRLEFSGDHQLRITAAKLTPYAPIVRFLHEKKSWIEKQRLKICRKNKTIEELRSRYGFAEGQYIPILGQERRVQHVPSPYHLHFCSIAEDSVRFHFPMSQANETLSDDSKKREAFVTCFTRESEKYISSEVNRLETQTSLHPRRFGFRNQSRRWGSCSSQGDLSLNRKLFCLSPASIEYVIIHELCHLQHLNHSQDFWDLVEKHCPIYKTSEKELKHSHLKIDYFFGLLSKSTD